MRAYGQKDPKLEYSARGLRPVRGDERAIDAQTLELVFKFALPPPPDAPRAVPSPLRSGPPPEASPPAARPVSRATRARSPRSAATIRARAAAARNTRSATGKT